MKKPKPEPAAAPEPYTLEDAAKSAPPPPKVIRLRIGITFPGIDFAKASAIRCPACQVWQATSLWKTHLLRKHGKGLVAICGVCEDAFDVECYTFEAHEAPPAEPAPEAPAPT